MYCALYKTLSLSWVVGERSVVIVCAQRPVLRAIKLAKYKLLAYPQISGDTISLNTRLLFEGFPVCCRGEYNANRKVGKFKDGLDSRAKLSLYRTICRIKLCMCGGHINPY